VRRRKRSKWHGSQKKKRASLSKNPRIQVKTDHSRGYGNDLRSKAKGRSSTRGKDFWTRRKMPLFRNSYYIKKTRLSLGATTKMQTYSFGVQEGLQSIKLTRGGKERAGKGEPHRKKKKLWFQIFELAGGNSTRGHKRVRDQSIKPEERRVCEMQEPRHLIYESLESLCKGFGRYRAEKKRGCSEYEKRRARDPTKGEACSPLGPWEPEQKSA